VAETISEEREDATDEGLPVSVDRAPPAPEVAVDAAPPTAEVAVENAPPASEVRELMTPPWAWVWLATFFGLGVRR
jgi:hypothetical protein